MKTAKCIQGLTWGCYTCRSMWAENQDSSKCYNCTGLRNCPISNMYNESKPECDGCQWEPEEQEGYR